MQKTARTERDTFSLHDALPIFGAVGTDAARRRRERRRVDREIVGREIMAAVTDIFGHVEQDWAGTPRGRHREGTARQLDRKSTRLNSSHSSISYAVFCLKKKTY